MQENLNNTVLSIKEIKKDLYEVNINNEIYQFVVETVLKYRLLKDKIVDNIDEIIKYNDLNKDYNKILNYCLKYPKSIYNFKLYLNNKYKDIDISYIIDKLINIKALDDKKYAQMKINSLLNKGYGINYIKNYLIYNDKIDNYIIDELLIDIETTNNIDETINKLIKRYNKLDNKAKREKIYNYLIKKGHNYNDFKTILDESLK